MVLISSQMGNEQLVNGSGTEPSVQSQSIEADLLVEGPVFCNKCDKFGNKDTQCQYKTTMTWQPKVHIDLDLGKSYYIPNPSEGTSSGLNSDWTPVRKKLSSRNSISSPIDTT
ncbi:hypothetical protein ACFE04_026054 [Oxalis oulophora]